jgi:hypothetical protein
MYKGQACVKTTKPTVLNWGVELRMELQRALPSSEAANIRVSCSP